MEQISGERQYDFVSKFQYIREAGTSGELQAAETILAELEAIGVSGRMEEFSFPAFEMEAQELTVLEPYEKSYEIAGYGFCGNTPREGIEAPFLYAENGDDISLAGARGKIVLVNGPVQAEMHQKLTRAGALAFLSIYGSPVDEGEDLRPYVYRLRCGEEKRLPGACLHCRTAQELVSRKTGRVRLTLRQRETERTSRNICARIEGTDKKEEILTLTAHYDSVPAGPGAYDNLSGSAIIMELCRYFKKNPPRRTLEFIWFGAEEKGLLGSQAYIAQHEEELCRHRFNMNVDLAGQLVGGNAFGVTAEDPVGPMLAMLAAETGIGVTILDKRIWGSDSNTFAYHGIPAMTMNRDGYGMHTRHDTIALISPWSLERSARLLGHVAERLGNMEVFPFQRSVPENLREQLEKWFRR